MKTLIIIILLILFPGVGHADIVSGLLVWWKFDDGSGTSATDSSGNGFTGTLTNAPTWTAGKIGDALIFNGTNNYVISPSLGVPPNSITLSAWINSGALGGVVLAELGQATINSGWHDSQIEVEASGTVKTCVWTGALSCVSATTALGFNQWHQVVLTYNVTTHTLSGYVDGTLGASSVVTKSYNTPLYYAVGPIDSTNAGNGVYFHGTVDDVRIYNRALSASDVAQLFGAHMNSFSHAHFANFKTNYY